MGADSTIPIPEGHIGADQAVTVAYSNVGSLGDIHVVQDGLCRRVI